jgi:hypothetical protein
MTPITFDWCFPQNAHPDARISDASLAHLADQMNAFVWGQFMDWNDGIDIKRLEPRDRDIWEIKSHLKLFVATNCAVRDDLEPISGPKWNATINLADQNRTTLVGHIDFFHTNPGEYVRNPT